jgi:hypothetical protein
VLTFTPRLLILLALFLPLLPAQNVSTRGELPKNLGLGLRELVQLHRARPAGSASLNLRGKTLALNPQTGTRILTNNRSRGFVTASAGRVLVTVVLDSSVALDSLRLRINAAGASITVEDPLQPNTLSVFLPLVSAETLANTPGISAIQLARRPVYSVGAVAPTTRTGTLALTFSGFVTGGFLTFGIDRDLASTNPGGKSADLLAGAKVSATFSGGTPATSVFANAFGTGYSGNDGFGLINVQAAIKEP